MSLTNRRREILLLLAEGECDKGIALALGISIYTVKRHITKMLRQAGARNRTHLAVIAVKEGWV